MFYFCAKLNAFKLPDLTEYQPSGGIIAASSMPSGMLQRRSFMPHPHLRHRMFDPQLYLAGLDCNTAEKTIFKLATYSWFGVKLEEYESNVHSTHAQYKEQVLDKVIADWPSGPPTEDKSINRCVEAALSFQIELGCEVLIAPAPLTSQNAKYTLEERYLDAACKFVKKNHISTPLLASVILSDALLRGFEPTTNTLLETIASHIAARVELAGAYLIVEQTADTGYVIKNRDTLFSLLVFADDVARGAGKRVVTNYAGHFGLVLTAAGAETWSSGYYRSQRRMRLADQEEQEGRAFPRLFSDALAGDVGVEHDITAVYKAGLLNEVLNVTEASKPLYKALKVTGSSGAAPGWVYKTGNVAAAAAHYLDVSSKMDAYSDAKNSRQRVNAIERWLKHADLLAKKLSTLNLKHTDVQHQAVWLAALQKWRDYSDA